MATHNWVIVCIIIAWIAYCIGMFVGVYRARMGYYEIPTGTIPAPPGTTDEKGEV